ncbi:hypothetical protein [Rhodonellum sp.]|uniref:hypothetical protein n=1 Tax=Rhodonellum sp. TaxID=2231180 RepID=UPI00272388A7|nr:hypothetical protein [Rhodonellum sp.]MDO9553761.1 hypothetical protein [Rhodonellum sp.]
MENHYLIVKKILHLMDVPFTKGFLKEKVESHPEPQSMLSLSDILKQYKIDSLGLKLSEIDL